MKKIWLYIICAIIGIIMITCGYCMIQGHIIQDKTYSYLETYGYTDEDIEQIDLKHSFLNKLLGHNEWRILVEFKKEPNIYYWFTYRNHKIFKEGISTPAMLHKNVVMKYNDQDTEFKNNFENKRYSPLEEWTKALIENPWEWSNKENVYPIAWLKTLSGGIGIFPYSNFESQSFYSINNDYLITFEANSDDGNINRFAIYDRNNHKWIFDCFDGGGGGYIEVDESIDIDKIDVNSCKEKYDEVINYLKYGVLIIEDKNMNTDNIINLKIGNAVFDVTLEENSATKALVEKLHEGDIVVNAREYGGFEKVGNLGFDLPRADKQITTEPGDIVLYQGNQISLFYESNSWSYTKLGKVQMVSKDGLKEILGDGDVTLVFSLLK